VVSNNFSKVVEWQKIPVRQVSVMEKKHQFSAMDKMW